MLNCAMSTTKARAGHVRGNPDLRLILWLRALLWYWEQHRTLANRL